MKVLEKVLKSTGLTRYELTKELNQRGISITQSAVYGWNAESESMRLDILVGIADIVKEKTGKDQLLDWLREAYKRRT